MTILINVINQELRLATSFKNLVYGTQNFIKFKFSLDESWDGLMPFAQFTQNNVSYNVYLDNDNCVYLPSEINKGSFTLMLYGAGNEIIGTTNYLKIEMIDNIFTEDGQSTEITLSLYNQLVGIVDGVNGKLDSIITANASDVGKYLKVRSVDNGKVSVWEFDEPSGGGSGGSGSGRDGVSPIVSVTNITNGHRVSITDVNGTKTFDVMNGTNGTNGFSPTISVTNITGGHRVSITDSQGTNSFDVMDGSGSGGSSVAVDTTLSVSGAAADAKKVGDEIDGLKEGLTHGLLNDVIIVNQLEDGYYSVNNGQKYSNSSTTSYRRSVNLIRVEEKALYYSNVSCEICCFNESRVFLGSIYIDTKATKSRRKMTPSGTVWAGIYATGATEFELHKVDSSKVRAVEYPYTGNDYIYIQQCWCNGTGGVANTANFDMLILGNVKTGDRYYVSNEATYNCLCFDEAGTLITAQVETRSPLGKIYTVPEGAKQMYVNLYNKRTKGINNEMSDYLCKVDMGKILAIGDSLTWLDGRENYGGMAYFSGWQRQLRLAGYDVINAGFSGYPYATGLDIVDGVDYSIYKEIVTNTYDVSGYDIVILFGGTNDVLYNGALGDRPTDYSNRTFDASKFNGALGAIISYIRTNNTTALILLASFPKSEAVTRSYTNAKSRVDEIEYNANFWSCKYIDVWSDLNIQPTYDGFDQFFYDTTHPNFLGMERIGKIMLDAVEAPFVLTSNESVAVDSTLTIEGAAANAKVVGDKFNSIVSSVSETGNNVTFYTVNLNDGNGDLAVAPVSSRTGLISPDNLPTVVSGGTSGAMTGVDKAKLDSFLISSPTNGQTLVYNSINGKWENSSSSGGGSSASVDNTLTISGAAADSKTVGDRISGLNDRVSTIEQEDAETADLLLGYTPQTLSSTTHIKLKTDSTASYSIIETVADYENNSSVTLTNVTQTWEDGKMVFTATGSSANECYVDIVINGLTIGRQYTFIVNRGSYISGTTGGYFRITDSNETEIESFDVYQNIQTVTFAAPTNSISIRLTPSINYYWETYGIRTATIIGIELESEITDSFTEEVDLGIISANATITSTPASQVYAVLKKSEISKSLIGYTPLAIEEESNIELSGSGTTQYTVSNIFVGDFDGNGDDVEVRFVDTTLTKQNGKMVFTATGSSASSCWADLRLSSLVVGRTYTLTVTRGEYISGTTGGYFVIYDRDGEELGRTGNVTQNVVTLDFVATTTFARVRLMPTTNSYWESNIKTATIVSAVVTTQVSDSFDGTIDLGRVPVGYVISSDPVCQVYAVYQKEEIRVDSSLNINSRNPVQNKVITEAINEIRNTSGSHLVGQTCVVLGDSVAAFRTPPEDIPSIIAQRTGMTVYNCAFGGCRISDNTVAQGDTDPWEAFCFVRLADAIVSGDWSYQEANIDTLQELDYDGYSPEDHFETIKSVNWSNVDILVIFFAGNDPGSARFDNPQDDDDTYYYLGAFRYCIRKILTAYPHLKLLVVGTDYHKSGNSNTDDVTYTIDGQTYHYYDWSDRLMEECKNFHIPTLDWYRSNGLNSLTVDYYMTSDGKHPNYIGNQLLGNQIANRLLSIY